jgi:hypothetical protein
MMSRSLVLKVMVFLALAQGMFGLLRALIWFRIGSELGGRGVLIGPLMALLASLRGGIVVVFVLLYFLVAWGAWRGRPWAWGLGLLASGANGLGAVMLLFEEGSAGDALLVTVIPLVLVWLLLSPTGRQAFSRE